MVTLPVFSTARLKARLRNLDTPASSASGFCADEEQIEELLFSVYRLPSIAAWPPCSSCRRNLAMLSRVEMVTIDPQDLQPAQELDLNHGA